MGLDPNVPISEHDRPRQVPNKIQLVSEPYYNTSKFMCNLNSKLLTCTNGQVTYMAALRPHDERSIKDQLSC